MCKVINERELVEAMRSPKTAKALLISTEPVSIEIIRIDLEDATKLRFYSLIPMTKKELYIWAVELSTKLEGLDQTEVSKTLKLFNIDSSLWYKYYEEKYTSNPNQSINIEMEPIMPGTKEQTQQEQQDPTSPTFIQRNMPAIKYTACLLLGAIAGFFGARAMTKNDSEASAPQHSVSGSEV